MPLNPFAKLFILSVLLFIDYNSYFINSNRIFHWSSGVVFDMTKMDGLIKEDRNGEVRLKFNT